MAKKKTRLQELEEFTRNRFFDKAGNSYFGPQSGIHTALGLKNAWDFVYAYAAGKS